VKTSQRNDDQRCFCDRTAAALCMSPWPATVDAHALRSERVRDLSARRTSARSSRARQSARACAARRRGKRSTRTTARGSLFGPARFKRDHGSVRVNSGTGSASESGRQSIRSNEGDARQDDAGCIRWSAACTGALDAPLQSFSPESTLTREMDWSRRRIPRVAVRTSRVRERFALVRAESPVGRWSCDLARDVGVGLRSGGRCVAASDVSAPTRDVERDPDSALWCYVEVRRTNIALRTRLEGIRR
jgi:hypothetical protein